MSGRTFRYHKDCPAGEIFDADIPGLMEELEESGWVDTPAKLNANYEIVQSEGSSDLLAQIEALTIERDQLARRVAELEFESLGEDTASSSGDSSVEESQSDRSLVARFRGGERLSYEELIVLANELGIKAKKNWKEATILKHINKNLDERFTGDENSGTTGS